jgi:replication factor A1
MQSSKGGAIQGSSKARDVAHFTEAIVEGLYYEVKGFYTYENRSTNIVIDNDVVIELKSIVKTKAIDPLTPDMSRYYFRFIDFAHVLSLGKGSKARLSIPF